MLAPTAGPNAPQHLLEVAYLSTTARGSSTACILCLENEHLHASNLGDSGAWAVSRQFFFCRLNQYGVLFRYLTPHLLMGAGSKFQCSTV